MLSDPQVAETSIENDIAMAEKPKKRTVSRARPVQAAAHQAALIPVARPLRSKGPLNASETDLTVYAGLKDGQMTATPTGFTLKAAKSPSLVTDNPSLASSITHKNLVEVTDEPSLRQALYQINAAGRRGSIADREAAVAGTLPTVEAALWDAFRVVLFVEDGDETIPAIFEDWKAGKLDKRSSPPSITLTRI